MWCSVACACFVACVFGDESQQPMCPHVMQRRRCTHQSPAARHSTQPSPDGAGSAISSRCVHVAAIHATLPDAYSPTMSQNWPELPLDAWRDTRDTLHRWTQIPGKMRLALSPPEPDWAQVTYYVTATGLTTGPIPCGDARTFQVDFDFVDHALRIATSEGGGRVLPLVPKTVKAFYAETLEAIASLGIECAINARPQEIPGAIPFDEDEEHRSYDPVWAGRFFQVLSRVDMTMKDYRGRFAGRTTPVHFFWGLVRPRGDALPRRAHAGRGLVAGRPPFPRPGVLRLHGAEARRSRDGAVLARRPRRVRAPVRGRAHGGLAARCSARVPRDDLRSGRGAFKPDREGDTRAAESAVAVRHLSQVLLVIRLGVVERACL